MPSASKIAKVNAEILELFQNTLQSGLPNSTDMVHLTYDIPNVSTVNKNDVYNQVLAYRKELREESLSRNKIVTHCTPKNSPYKKGAWLLTFTTDPPICEEASVIKQVVEDYCDGRVNFNDYQRKPKELLRVLNI